MHVRAVGKIHPQVKPGCTVRKNWREPGALNLWNPGCLAWDFCEKKLRFSSQPGAKVTCQYSEGASDHWALLEHVVGFNQYSPYVIKARTQTKSCYLSRYLNMHTLSFFYSTVVFSLLFNTLHFLWVVFLLKFLVSNCAHIVGGSC